MSIAEKGKVRTRPYRYCVEMTTIVLDTNAMPHGQYRSRTINELRRFVGDATSIVVPEVVVWEWAEHAHRAQLALQLTVEQHRVDPGIVPGTIAPTTPSLEHLVGAIAAALADQDVELWTPGHEAWKDAVRQQVLQVGSGETKKDVKTGAADAIVLKCAESFAYESEPPVILLTSDAQLRLTATREVADLMTANGTHDVLRKISEFTPATIDLEVRAAEVLPDLFNARLAEGGPVISFDEFGIELLASGGRSSADFSMQLQRLEFREVDLIEFHDFEVASVVDGRVGLGNMRIFGSFELSFLESRETTPGRFELVGDLIGPFSDYVDVTVAISWDVAWQFQDIKATGVAVAVLGDDDYDEDGVNVPPFRAQASSAARS